MDHTEIGAVLRVARKERRISQADLARSLGMSRATISAIETGAASEIGVRKLMNLCAALGLSLAVIRQHARPTLQELRNERRADKTRD